MGQSLWPHICGQTSERVKQKMFLFLSQDYYLFSKRLKKIITNFEKQENVRIVVLFGKQFVASVVECSHWEHNNSEK